jgi:hypothetical protein
MLTFLGTDLYQQGGATAFVDNIHLNVAAVPEPGSCAMLLAGLGLMGLVSRRRKSQPQA